MVALGFARDERHLSPASAHGNVPILLYHRFDPEKPATPWTLVSQVFEQQLQWLVANKCTVVPLRTIVESRRTNVPVITPRALAITVDDGNGSVYTEMFPIIRNYGVPVTLFVYPYAISLSPDALTWEQLEEMVRSGLVDVQFHTLSHPDFSYERPRRSLGDYRAFVQFELTHLRDKIENRLGVAVDLLAWPFGIYDEELMQAAAECGYAAAFAVKNRHPSENTLFAIPRISVTNRDIGDAFRARVGLTSPPAMAAL